MKFLFLTDTHFRVQNPRWRKDHFLEALEAKVRTAGEIARKEDVAAVFHGGDLFDSPQPSYGLALRVYQILLEAFEDRPVYVVPGNHDVIGYNPSPDILNRTALGLGAGLGIYRILGEEPAIFKTPEGKTVAVTGAPFHADMDRRERLLDYSPKARFGDLCVHIVHGMLLPRPIHPDAPSTSFSDIEGTLADLIFTGHYHEGFAPRKAGRAMVYNPGAVARLEHESRPIQVYLFDDEGHVEARPLPFAPADTIAQPSWGEKTGASEALSRFLEGLSRTRQTPTQSAFGVLETVARELAADPLAVERAKALLSAAAEEGSDEP
ncbi:MAG: metallophosphoesterase family protein [Clostridiales bacterium]|nr:metallophosphoesterase family protein [Clostridiales bacterium]